MFRSKQKIIEEKLKTDKSNYLTNYLEKIRKHRILIQNKNWSRD